MKNARVTRRTLLKATAAAAIVAGFPLPLRAQPKTFKIGAIHPVTGVLAEPGQACRLGARMAVEAINAAGGIKSKGGLRLELIVADTQSKPENGRVEAERVVSQGALMLLGSFDSGSTNAMASVAQQKRVPFLIDIAAADPITANVARSVKEGQQKVQYVYRNFPTASSFGRRAVQYFNEMFKEANASPKRVVLMYCNDLFGQSQARGFQAAHKAASPSWDIVEAIPWPEPPSDLATEVMKAKAAKPDVIAPITRPASARLLFPEIRKQGIDLMGIVGPGSPGLYEAGQLAQLKEDLEYVLTSVPWANFKNPKTSGVAADYRKRSGGKTFDTNSGYSYDTVFVIADILERATSLADPDAIADAMNKTSYAGGLMQYGGPVAFNELGDNVNAIPTMIQILNQTPVAVWPREAALQPFVFPRPKA
jgi:branched-chain amino acid transport system substrate-binding protein